MHWVSLSDRPSCEDALRRQFSALTQQRFPKRESDLLIQSNKQTQGADVHCYFIRLHALWVSTTSVRRQNQVINSERGSCWGSLQCYEHLKVGSRAVGDAINLIHCSEYRAAGPQLAERIVRY
jgi:hypothetical protein